ncbi:MBL fold metallo-hydrolase [Tenuifilum thalassicum]|uniref:MBL fold metallo-hydrolase n=1 Tax=Tenuifilum thalassicum TaxID=2590900 RepID=A0A7D4BQR6_9BACT|nr:MBL fold metallo-hydrolase [Tenuifilum thalassicum]QKG79041.1 MBL fold metallo-hydrolase [Tenuifilum thalassicum]
MKLSFFNITNFKIDGGAMFGVVPKVLWSRVYPSDENNLIPLALKSLIIETGDRVILIDNGIGDKQDEKFMSHVHAFGGEGLIAGLAKRGYKAEDITDVILTHLHYDHCGGGTYRDKNGQLQLTFPNAKYHVTEAQWEWAINPNPREADAFLPENLLPMRDKGALNLIKEEGELFPGVEIRIFNGHTRGQIIPIVSYKGRKLVFVADLFPFRAHIPLPWIMSYDVEPLKTLKEKEVFLQEALEGNYIFIYQHDYYADCSKVVETPKGIRASDPFTFEELMNELG